MRDREEMLRDLHRRMDEYESDRRMKRAKMTKVAASVTPVCAAAVVGVGLWKGGALTPHNDQLIASTVESTASDVILSSDNDTSADKHSGNDKNIKNNVEPATAASTADQQAATSDATIPRTTENGENVIKDSATEISPVEASTPTAEVKSSSASDNATITNNESQRTTETPVTQTDFHVQQTTPPVQQTEPATQSIPAEQTTPNTGDSNMWCMYRSTIEWNGITYNDNETVDAAAYSRDKYIGKVSEFGGDHQNNSAYRVNPDDDVYTTKENAYVLIVVKANGTVIAMTNPAYLDGVVYKPHTEDVPYEDFQEWN